MAKMTIRQCMDAALQLLNQYSITGTIVPLSYNDQADTEKRMVNLINDAQMEIATTVRPISAFHTFSVPEVSPNTPLGQVEVTMPDDFMRFKKLYFTPTKGCNLRTIESSDYKWIGDDIILVPDRPQGVYKLEYERYPERYLSSTDTATELDNTRDTHGAIPYFVAAMIAIDENPKAYYALYNVWETKLSRIGYKNPYAVNGNAVDAYGFGNLGGFY